MKEEFEEPDFTDEQLDEIERWQEEENVKRIMADADKEKDKAIVSTLADVERKVQGGIKYE